MMKKVNLLAVGGEPKPPNGLAAHGGPPTIVVSDAPEPLDAAQLNNKGASSDRSDGGRSPDRRKAEKEKKERERLEKLERKELKKLEKEQKKSPKGGDGGKEAKDVISAAAAAAGGKESSPSGTPPKDSGGSAKLADRFLGSKVAMEKFFKKKVKEREERKEKEKEERERERVLLEELSASGDEGSAGDAAKHTKKPKKKKSKMGSKISIGKGYYSEGSNDDGLVDGRKKKRKTFSSSGSASSSSTSTSPSSSYTPPSPAAAPRDKDKDPMERETEREEEKEEETTDSDDSSSSDDSESEEEPTNGRGSLLHPNSGNNALRQHRRKKDWTVSQEFRVLALETEEKQKPDFSFALQHKNRDKNRYGNALPNPATRVVLKGGDTDYINANYIQGEQTQYIAAQAPLPNTFSDFWLMVWEQNTRVIMMLTRLTENDRTKAEIYWPRKGPLGRARGGTSEDGDDDDDAAGWKQYGKMRVSLVKSTIQEGDEDVTIRHFRLRNDEEPDVERQVIQIHFTGWPDFGVPQNTKAFTQLLELMESFNQEPTITDSTEPNGPIVLHCSAGLGRTGTLIAAHIAAEKLKLHRVKSKEDIDMKAIVAILREQRSGMVQTKCQYKFLHDLLNDL